MEAPIVHLVDDGAVLARAGSLLVGVWWHTATIAHVEGFRGCAELILAEFPKFATAIIVLEGDDVFVFSDEVRRSVTAVVRDTEASGAGTAFVILRGGFGGAIVRAFLSGAFLVARSKEPQKAFSEIPAASAWLTKRLDDCRPARDEPTGAVEAVLTRVLALAQDARKSASL